MHYVMTKVGIVLQIVYAMCRDGVYVAFGTLVGVPPECLLAFVTYLGARALR